MFPKQKKSRFGPKCEFNVNRFFRILIISVIFIIGRMSLTNIKKILVNQEQQYDKLSNKYTFEKLIFANMFDGPLKRHCFEKYFKRI